MQYMKRLLPVCILLFAGFVLMIFSCKRSDPDASSILLIGKWKLKQQFSSEGKNMGFEEFPLSFCEKMTTLEIAIDGSFVEKSYYEDFGTGGECLKDTEETLGNWKKEPDGTINFIYNQKSVLLFTKSDVVLKNGHLVITIAYDDPDLGHETTLQFIYTKVEG